MKSKIFKLFFIKNLTTPYKVLLYRYGKATNKNKQTKWSNKNEKFNNKLNRLFNKQTKNINIFTIHSNSKHINIDDNK